MKLILVAGARPNFMKIASIIEAIKIHNASIENSKSNIQHLLVHTGQHYDNTMSEAFFRDLNLPKPDIYLEVGSGSHAVQTAEIMKRFEPVLLKERPDVVMVVGDVNSTVACALVASKVKYPVTGNRKPATSNHRHPLIAHVEAGLRSFDRTMPEEVNRILTDQLSDFLFVSERAGIENLKNEGFKNFLRETDTNKISYDSPLTIHHSLPIVAFVGNTMIDTMLKYRELAQRSTILSRLGLLINSEHQETKNEKPTTNNQVLPYAVLTLHRPSNVDDDETFQNILEALSEVSEHIPIIFPVHPRTLNRIKEFNFEDYFNFNSVLRTQPPHIYCLDPLGYFDFLCLMSNSKLVLTDSGGMQEETTVLGIPCITMRANTERPVTITFGTNILAGVQKEQIIRASLSALRKYDSISPIAMFNTQHSFSPPLWDGKAGQRIIQILVNSP